MQPERIVRSMSDLKKAMHELDLAGKTIVVVGGRKALLLPWDPTDELTDREFEAMLSHTDVSAQLDKAVAQADAGMGIADKDLDALFNDEEE